MGNEFVLDPSLDVLDKFSVTWKHSPMLNEEKYKYLFILARGENLEQYSCQPDLFMKHRNKLEAQSKAAVIAKVDLHNGCFFDILPNLVQIKSR